MIDQNSASDAPLHSARRTIGGSVNASDTAVARMNTPASTYPVQFIRTTVRAPTNGTLRSRNVEVEDVMTHLLSKDLVERRVTKRRGEKCEDNREPVIADLQDRPREI